MALMLVVIQVSILAFIAVVTCIAIIALVSVMMLVTVMILGVFYGDCGSCSYCYTHSQM